MKKKDVYRFVFLAGTIVFLLGFVLYARIQESIIESRREAALAPFFTGKPDDIGYVVMSKGEQRVELVKQDDRWMVMHKGKPFPASPDDVKDLLEYFCGLTPENLIDDSGKSFTDYEVDDLNAVAVQLYGKKGQEKPLLEMFMGKSGSDYYSVYARKGGDNSVYQIGGNKSTLWNRDMHLWRDKYPLRENRDDITTIAVTAKGVSFTLQRDESGFWNFTDDKVNKVNQELTVSLISRLTGLVGLRLIDAATPDMKLDQPEYQFALTIGARKTTVSISPEVGDKRFVRNSELNQIYEISSAAVSGLQVERKDYVAVDKPKQEASAGDGSAPAAPGNPATPVVPPAPPAVPEGGK